jgi:hypothetical protein
MRCPNCGGFNPEDASWCGQCYARFDGRRVKGTSSGEASELQEAFASLAPSNFEVTEGPFAETLEESKPAGSSSRLPWACSVCGTSNSLELNRCRACGSSIAQTFGGLTAPEPAATLRDPKVAAALSIVPGAGHLYLGQTAQGVVRLILAAWWLGTAFVLSAEALSPIRLLFLSAWAFLAGVSVIDAYRAAGADRRPPILSRQMILYLSLALIAILTFGTMGLFVSAR